jgi:hypothetical protein
MILVDLILIGALLVAIGYFASVGILDVMQGTVGQ